MRPTPSGSTLETPVAVTVIVPVYDEEESIGPLVRELRGVLEGFDAEIVVVDDGSTDGTAGTLSRIEEGGSPVRVLRHERNLGYGAALKTGIRRARGEIVVIIDADGTYPVDRIPELVELVGEADMAVGARTGESVAGPLLRRAAKAVLRRWVAWLSGRRVPDMNSGLRAFRREVAERFLRLLPDGFSFTTTLTIAMLRNAYSVVFLPVSYHSRVGRSKIRPVRDLFGFLQLIVRTGMTFAPLRLLGPVVLGLGAGFGASLVYDVFVLRNLTDKTVLLLLFTLNTLLFALLADMIDKRSG